LANRRLVAVEKTHNILQDDRTARWIQLGPSSIPNGPTYSDSGDKAIATGRITSLVIDPSNNKCIYIGAAQGGVWKTTNGGNSWSPTSDHMDSLAI
jgi:hypothetical protein